MDPGSFLVLLYQAIVLVGTGLRLAFGPKPVSWRRAAETLLHWSLAVNLGIGGLMAFYAHTFRAAQTAESIGWAPGSPFQLEVAFANLAYSALGFGSLWLRGLWWWAAAVSNAVFLWGAAYGHIVEIIQHQNYAPGNAGAILYADILVPAVHLILLVLLHVTRPKPLADSV